VSTLHAFLCCDQSTVTYRQYGAATVSPPSRLHPGISPVVPSQAPLSPEIHGETGLDSESGARGMPAPQRAAVPRKAVLLMFERISTAFAAWCAVHKG